MGTSPPVVSGPTTGTVQEGTGVILSGSYTDSSNNNAANTWSISQNASYGTVSINPTTGQLTYDLNDTNAAVHALDPGQTLTDVFKVRVTDDGGTSEQTVTITIQGNFCFCAGTRLRTMKGQIGDDHGAIDQSLGGQTAVEDIKIGDMVWTLDRGFQPVRWIGSEQYSKGFLQKNPNKGAVLIGKGALGHGLPERDLYVSRQHRVLVKTKLARRLAGADGALIAAHRLIGMPGIHLAETGGGVHYFHLLFDRHEVVLAEGLPTETLLIGPEIDKICAVGGAIPPHLCTARASQPARKIPRAALQKDIAAEMILQATGGNASGPFEPANLVQGGQLALT